MSTSSATPAGTVTHWTISHGLSGYLPMSDDTTAWLSWSDAREALLADMRDYADTDDDAAYDVLSTVPATDYPQDENGEPIYGDDAPSMLATVSSMIADGDVAPTVGEEWSGWVDDSDGRTIYFSLSRHESSECEDSCELADGDELEDGQRYAVTFASGPIVGIGALDGLRRMTLDDARALVAYAIPRAGRIVNVDTLAVVED